MVSRSALAKYCGKIEDDDYIKQTLSLSNGGASQPVEAGIYNVVSAYHPRLTLDADFLSASGGLVVLSHTSYSRFGTVRS